MSISLGVYLFRRIHEIGVRSIMGVPGDYQLKLLDKIYEVDGLKWIGNANELNAAYAADGYARVKQGAGCVITTHGAGELSAINGVAGAMSEHIKVIHIVGQTARHIQDNHTMVHHNIGHKPDHSIYSTASKDVCIDVAKLWHVKTAPAEIDRVIRACFLHSRPVYIYIPVDMVDEQVSETLLDDNLDLEPSASDNVFLNEITELIYKAKAPVIYVDCLAYRHNITKFVHLLIESLRFPVYCSTMGKGIVDEKHDCFVGVYAGAVSDPGVAESFEQNDLIIAIGRLPANTNTGGFTQRMPITSTIELGFDHVRALDKDPVPCHIRQYLPRLLEVIDPSRAPQTTIPRLRPRLDSSFRVPGGLVPHKTRVIIEGQRIKLNEVIFDHWASMGPDQPDAPLDHAWLWEAIDMYAFKRDDVVFADTGTSTYGLQDCHFNQVNYQIQAYWGSIGWATPATLGADVALGELFEGKKNDHHEQNYNRSRTLLFTGDGSFQLTMQEIGTMIQQNVRPTIFIINNAGYTIERVIHGPKQPYNNIFPCNHSHLLKLFGMSNEDAERNFTRCTTRLQLLQCLVELPAGDEDSKLKVVEIVVDAFDAPWRLTSTLALGGEEQVRKMREGGFKVNGL